MQYLLRMPKLVESLAQRPKESARFLHALIGALLSDKIHTAASLKLLERIVEQVALGGVATAAAGQLLVSGLSAEEQELQTLMSIFRCVACSCVVCPVNNVLSGTMMRMHRCCLHLQPALASCISAEFYRCRLSVTFARLIYALFTCHAIYACKRDILRQPGFWT